MALAERIHEHLESSRPGGKCTVGRYLNQLPPAERDELAGLIDGGMIACTVIYKAVRDEYPKLEAPQPGSLQRHRNRECRCP